MLFFSPLENASLFFCLLTAAHRESSCWFSPAIPHCCCCTTPDFTVAAPDELTGGRMKWAMGCDWSKSLQWNAIKISCYAKSCSVSVFLSCVPKVLPLSRQCFTQGADRAANKQKTRRSPNNIRLFQMKHITSTHAHKHKRSAATHHFSNQFVLLLSQRQSRGQEKDTGLVWVRPQTTQRPRRRSCTLQSTLKDLSLNGTSDFLAKRW